MSEVQVENGLSEEVLSSDQSGVTDEDRAEILKEIDKVVDENKITVTSELFELKPAKKGIFLPIFVNILAVVVIIGGFFLASWYFEQQRESLSTEAEGFLSAEGRLIAELKRDAESILQEKDNEIGEIQTQLDQIEQERAELVQTMDQQVRDREEELRAALDIQLSLEKSRLEALGKSDEDISGQLAELEQRVTAEQTAELNAFKTQAEEIIRAKEDELERNKELTEQILAEARNERQDLEEKSKAREEELVAQYEEEKAALAEQATEAETRLQQVTASQAREKLVSDQIIGTYSLVDQKIDNGNFSAAMADLDQLKTMLYQPSINNLPNVAARRDSDLFIIEALEELVEIRAAVQETKTTDSILQTASLLETARGAVSRADDAFAGEDNEAAKRLYTDALNLVPSLGRAYTNLSSITTEESRQTLTAGLAEGTGFFETGNIDGAVAAYSTAVISAAPDNSSLVQQAVEGVSDALSYAMNRQATENRAAVDGLNRELTGEQRRVSDLTSSLSTASAQIASLESANRKLEADGEALAAENTSLDAVIDLRDASIEAANSRVSRLEEQLAAETASALDLEARLSSRAEEVSDLETQLTGQSAKVLDLESRLSVQAAKVSDLEEQLSTEATGTTGLKAQLSAQTARVSDLEAQLSTQAAKVSELEELLAFQTESLSNWTLIAADLETQLAVETGKVTDLAAEAVKTADLTDRVSTARAQIEGLTADLAEAEEDGLALRNLLSDARADIVDLEGELGGANETIASLNSSIDEGTIGEPPASVVGVQLAPLRTAYENAAELIEPLIGTESEEDIRDAKQIFSVFFERVNDLAFPGIYATWSKVDTAFIDLESSLAEESGRTNALNEVIRYVDYVGAGSGASTAASLAFDALAKQDLLYKRAFDDIAGIAAGTGNTTVRKAWTLAGTVVSFAAGKVIVNVDSGFAAAVGSKVLVKRLSEAGVESDVAEGVVTDVSDGVMEADLRFYLDPTTPKQEDLVFLEYTLE